VTRTYFIHIEGHRKKGIPK